MKPKPLAREFLINRGYCCGNGCKYCPYFPKHTKNSNKVMNNLTFNDYKEQAITTKIYPEGLAIPYVTLGLVGEAGEVAEKVKKIIRDENGQISEEKKALLSKEIGDVLWYCAALADELQLDFGQIAQDNIDKLQARKNNGTLKGSGDNR